MRITHLLVSGLLATAVTVQLAIADDDGERTALARITCNPPGKSEQL